jgi:hypothetical protein
MALMNGIAWSESAPAASAEQCRSCRRLMRIEGLRTNSDWYLYESDFISVSETFEHLTRLRLENVRNIRYARPRSAIKSSDI